MIIASLTYSLIAATINAIRGSGAAKKYAITSYLFSKWVCVVYFFGLLYLILGNPWVAAVFLLPIIFKYATGTGGLHYTFLKEFPKEFFIAIKYKYFDNLLKKIFPRINNIGEFPPFDWLCDKVVGKVKTIDDLNDWGFIYGSLVGILFTLPFFITGNIYGVLMIFLGLFCYLLKFVKINAKWRIVEFFYILLYFTLAGL
jgi:hypothetical protein